MNIIGISDTARYMKAYCRIIYNIIIFIKYEIMKETGRAEKFERSRYAPICSALDGRKECKRPSGKVDLRRPS